MVLFPVLISKTENTALYKENEKKSMFSRYMYNNHIIGRHTNVNHSGFWIYLYLIVVQDVKEIKY